MKLLSTRKIIFIVLSIVLVSFALGAFGESQLNKDKGDIYHDLELFANIVEKIQSTYVDDIDMHKVVVDAIQGMLKELDPHSQYLDGLDYEDLMVSTRGEFGGLGIYISFRDNYPTVISAIDDTPAEKAGLHGGDQIVEIEGNPTKGWQVDKAVGFLRGEPGTTVHFKVARPGSDETTDYVITREVINVKSVPYSGMFENKTGYIKVSTFSRHTTDELRSALSDLEAQGMKSLVLDFRMNPGGLLQTATEVSEMFLNKDKLLVYTKGRMPNSSHKYYSSNRTAHGGYPIVIMINGGSASASEIFAGAMQDWDAAFVVGQTSFGKGTVQTVFNLSDTEAVKLTTAKYYTPSGRSIHRDRSAHEEMLAEGVVSDDGEGTALVPTNRDNAIKEKTTTETPGGSSEPGKDKPVYYTSSGRLVYGGGGIAPDLEFTPQTYTELERRLERDGLAFSFAVEYNGNNDVPKEFKVDDKVLADFYAFLQKREFVYKPEELTDETVSYIRTMVAREAVNNKYGRKDMYRVLLNSDPEFQDVLKILKQAPTLKEMFAYGEQQKGIKKASNE